MVQTENRHHQRTLPDTGRTVLVVQSIHTFWGEKAACRSDAFKQQVAEALPIPNEPAMSGLLRVLYHKFASNAWQQHTVEIDPEPECLQVGCVTIVRRKSDCVLECRYTRRCGAPCRYWMDRDFTVAPGEWVQIVYNGRFSWVEDSWWYEKNVVNAGLFETVTPDVFVRTKPNERFSAMAHLW